MNAGTLSQMRYTSNSHFLYHMLYADDILLFCAASLKNMKLLRDTFVMYSNNSRQSVNWAKSRIYFGSSVVSTHASHLADITGI